MVGSVAAVMTPNNHIRHNVQGDVRLQDATSEEQKRLVDAVLALQRAVESISDTNAKVAISADIKVKVSSDQDSNLVFQFSTGDSSLQDALTRPTDVRPSRESIHVYEPDNRAGSTNGEERRVKRPRTNNDRPDWERRQGSAERSESVDHTVTSTQATVPDNAAVLDFLSEWRTQWAVSYTHLTLPTKRIV